MSGDLHEKYDQQVRIFVATQNFLGAQVKPLKTLIDFLLNREHSSVCINESGWFMLFRQTVGVYFENYNKIFKYIV